jgi:hypothetical protein
MAPILWTVKGSEDQLAPNDYLIGTKLGSRINRTHNGWPDTNTVIIWAHMMVEHKKKQGLEKMLIFCDNAGIHFNDEVNALFASNNIMLFGLIPASSGYTQPLDLKHFGLVKPKLESLALKEGVLLTPFNIAYFYEMACVQLEETARKHKRSMLSAGFHDAGIYPFNPEITRFHTMKADARILPTKEAISAGAKRGKMGGLLLKEHVEQMVISAITGKRSETAMALEPYGTTAKKARLDAYGKRKAAADPLDVSEVAVENYVGRICPTSEQYVKAKKRKAENKELQEQQEAQAAVEKAAMKAAEKAAREAAKTAAKMASKKAKLEEKESKQAEKDIWQLMAAFDKPPKPAKPAKKAEKLVKKEVGNVYAKEYRAPSGKRR